MEWEPVTARGREVMDYVGAERWLERVEGGRRRVEVVESVRGRCSSCDEAQRAYLASRWPDVPWSTFRNWCRKYDSREGAPWERLLDHRIPPEPVETASELKVAACMLRRGDRSMNTETAREHLVSQFGESGALSDATLRRIWAAAELRHIRRGCVGVGREDVEVYHGGGGLALVAAADAELGASRALAEAVLEDGQSTAKAQGELAEPNDEPEGVRDELGRFTADFNRWCRSGVEAGEADARLDSDAAKAGRRDLRKLPVLRHEPEVLGRKLLSMGVVPLLSERRGFVGLEGPAGAWLGLHGGTAYMPATLDKTLAELGLLGVNEAMWNDHATRWCEVSRRWTAEGPAWQQLAVYIDATQDPYWTSRFALSGKVSRVGRVMPCLTRVAVTAGAGVPLLVETAPGTVSLKSKLIDVLERLDEAVGDQEVGRLTIMDAEMGTRRLLATLFLDLQRPFITVLKGGTLKAAKITPAGDWQPYRQQDELRELDVMFDKGDGIPAGGLVLRGVEMHRPASRRPTSTVFVTDLRTDALPTPLVADAYLSRWPHQEQVFRDSRNGGGGNRSHGYGGEYVTHVALETRLEKAGRTVARTEQRLASAIELHEQTSSQPGPGNTGGGAHDKEVRKVTEREVKRTAKAVDKAKGELERLRTMPRLIYARDPTRDNIMTCLKLHALMLVEFVLKEYFGGLRMEWRTFIEQLNMLPVTVRTSPRRVLHQIHTNPRQPTRMDDLRRACEVINERGLRRGERRLVFEVIDPDSPGS